jgi:solute carrier family 35, member F1/2
MVHLVGLMVGFSAFLFAMYSVVPYMLRLSGSTLFNLSLLTSDAYAVIFGILFFSKVPSWLYFVALIIIVICLLCYNVRNEPQSALAPEDPPSRKGYDQICDETGESAKEPSDIETASAQDVPVDLEPPEIDYRHIQEHSND